MIEKVFGKAKGIFNIITIINLCMGLLSFLIGLIFFINSDLSDTLVSIFTGLILITNGIVSIISFIKRNGIELFNYNLIYGILLIIIGIIAMFSNKILTIILGIYYIVSGIQKGNYALLLKKFQESSWLFVLVVGILFIALGVTAFFVHDSGIIEATGICLMGYGIINIINTILLRHRSEFFIA